MYGIGGTRSFTRLAATLLAALVLFAGCSTSTSDEADTAPPTSTSTTSDTPEAPSSGELIATALAAGEIDRPTALLYQVWAQFGDPSLPQQFQGAPAPHDLSVLAEARRSLDELPPKIRSKVAPFFKRPADPESAFSASADANEATSSRGRSASASTGQPKRCHTEWVSKAVPDLPLRVWACPDLGQDRAAEVIAATSEVLSEFAGDMFADLPDGLGPPIPDDPSTQVNPDADERIDLYALPEGWMAPYREGNERVLGEMAGAAAMDASPRTSTSSSAYIVFRAEDSDKPDLLAFTLAHELFHAQQYAHFSIDAGLANDSIWAYDATANWAAGHYLVDLDVDLPLMKIAALQASPLSIHADAWRHAYWAYLWPLFIEQELGEQAVFQMWTTMDSVPADAPGGAAIAALGEQLDIAEAFPDFVMRLFNAKLPGNPISPRFVDALSYLRDGMMPTMEPAVLSDEALQLGQAGIPGLGYRYNKVSIDATPQDPVPVTVSHNLTTDSGTSVSVEALVRGPDGNVTREVIEPDGRTFCVAGDIFVVVANPSVVIDDQTTGSVTFTRTGASDCTTPPDSSTTSSTPPTTSCADTGGWTTAEKSSEFRLNAPIVAVTGQTSSCYDTIVIGLDTTAAEPGYAVKYVSEVTEPGSGKAVPVAGTHSLEVVIDSPTRDRRTPDFAPTVETSDNMVDVTGFGVVRQVAHAGSFEAMTTFAIGVDGKQPFSVETGDHSLIIKIARSN